MAKVSTSRGLLFPTTDIPSGFVTATLDTTGQRIAHIGQLYLPDRTASTKTLSSGGGGKIQFMLGTTTIAGTLDIGLQDVATGAGPIAQPDGTFDVKATLVASGLTSNVWNDITMTTGTKTMSHGDYIAVVWDLTTAVADSIVVRGSLGLMGSNGQGFPVTNFRTGGAWQTGFSGGAGAVPQVILVFDDASIGWLANTIPITGFPTETLSTSSPDERGLMFQVPWDCSIDGFWFLGSPVDADGDWTWKMYSDPTGTPAAISGTTTTVLAERMGLRNSQYPLTITKLATEVNLTKNTNYALTMLATGAAGIKLAATTIEDEDYRIVYPGGTTLAKVTRNGSTGAFTAESPAVTIYCMGISISAFEESGGSGGTVARVIGG